MGHGQHSSQFVVFFVIRIVLLSIVLFCVLFVCKCVLYYCHQVATQLQLTNISIACSDYGSCYLQEKTKSLDINSDEEYASS
jgi:hypothetical protein